MKKIFKFSVIISLCAALVSLAGCQKEMNVDPMGESFSFNGMAPNPVMRGGALRIFGRSLDQVSEVRFAGDVSVTEFVELKKGARLDTLELIVPVEGPEVGKVTVVAKDGRELSSLSNLEFTEPIEVYSFVPEAVLSGDVITIKGEYLNVVKEVIFSGEDAVSVAFESQSRKELKVKLPANAVSGPVILSDVNEIEDQTTIPNHVYFPSDLTVGDPTVTKAAKATYKSGDVITVSGDHLDMIKNVALPQVSEVVFTVSEDTKSITFNLSPKAADGNITLTSFAGKEFDAGEIETVSVTELSVKSLAEDERYKAGCEVEITGSDLDLVTKVEFTGAEASWYLRDGKILATQPAEAQDGAITVTLDSGKQAYSDDIEVVKPIVTGIDKTEAVAGVDTLVVSGTDLDLVTAIVIGTKDQTFIDCEFEFDTDDNEALVVRVAVPEAAYSAAVTLSSAAGYETQTDFITVTYDMAISIAFEAYEFQFGAPVTVSGKNLLQVESMLVKGKKVTSYLERTDKSLVFNLPEGVGPGIYRLEITLIDGTQITWPVPFSVVAPYTETFIWEGYEDLGSWSNQPYFASEDAFINAGIKEGDQVRIYYTPLADWWQFQTIDGHWTNIELPELDGGYTVSPENQEPGQPFFAFEVTEAVLAQLTAILGWGGAFLSQGENVAITAISLIQFGAAPAKRDVIWEGNLVNGDWDASLGALSWGGYDWSTVQPGTVLSVAFTTSNENAVMRFGNGSWTSLPSLAGLAADGNIPVAGLTSYEFELTEEDLNVLVNEGGLVICGAFWTLTEVALVSVSAGPALPTGETIWEGSVTIDWGGSIPGAEGSMGALSWGGYDWSTVDPGTVLSIVFDFVDGYEAQIRVSNGSWSALPGTVDPYKPEASPLDVELTQEMLDELVSAGGLVITGQGVTLTEVILK